jgi:DNA-binding transcriptional regulator YiaG
MNRYTSRLGACVLECGGKQSATPLSKPWQYPNRASHPIPKRCRNHHTPRPFGPSISSWRSRFRFVACIGTVCYCHQSSSQSIGRQFPLSWGRVALLGIAQRQVQVSRMHIPAKRQHRKPLPTSIQTLGDLIQVKRYEKRLTLGQLAQKMGIAPAEVRIWEQNGSYPDSDQCIDLARILEIDVHATLTGFCQIGTPSAK